MSSSIADFRTTLLVRFLGQDRRMAPIACGSREICSQPPHAIMFAMNGDSNKHIQEAAGHKIVQMAVKYVRSSTANNQCVANRITSTSQDASHCAVEHAPRDNGQLKLSRHFTFNSFIFWCPEGDLNPHDR